MGAPVAAYGPFTATAVTDGGTAETVVLTTDPIIVPSYQRKVTIQGYLNITPGTSAVSCVIKVRRGTTTSGTQVGSTETALTIATDNISIPFLVSDQPGDSAGVQYVVTVVEGSAGANGTVNIVSASILVSS
jgi:hypothetical protein